MDEKKITIPAAEADPLSLVADEEREAGHSGGEQASVAATSTGQGTTGNTTRGASEKSDSPGFIQNTDGEDGGSAEDARQRLGIPARYQQLRFVGDGGMSVVYRAIDTENGDRLVALKFLKEELSRDASVVERFQREVAAMKTLTHQNIVQILDSGETTTGFRYFVSEYIDGGTLEELTRREGHLSADRSRTIFVQICHALEFAHSRRIVHRDIKPSNILLYYDQSGSEIAKLADFGIAKPPSSEPMFDTDLTRTGMILGSPAYMSPEQCRGHTVDERSDIYSLGCVMYETLSGTSPFAAENPIKAIVRHLDEAPQPFAVAHKKLRIPGGMEQLVMKCLEKEPKNRYQTCGQLLKVLSLPVIEYPVRVPAAFLIDLWICLWGYGIVSQCIPPAMLPLDIFFALCLYPLYFAGFESSRFGATPGKLLFGLRVRAKDGLRQDFLTALLVPLFGLSVSLLLDFTPLLFLAGLPIGSIEILKQAETTILAPAVVFCMLLAWFVDRSARCVGLPITAGTVAPCRRVKAKVTAIAAMVLLPVLATMAAPELAAFVADSGDVPVVVASKSIKAGTRLDEKNLRIFHVPHYFLPIPSAVPTKEELIGRLVEMDTPRYRPIVREIVLPLALEKAGYTHHAGIIEPVPTLTAIYDPATGKRMTPENAAGLLLNQDENFKHWRKSDKYNPYEPLNLPKDFRTGSKSNTTDDGE